MMQIQVNTDNQIDANDEFIGQVQEHLHDKLRRFENRITRLEVHFTDENSSLKKGDNDKRCQIEARLNGLKPISVTAQDAAILQALTHATKKLQSALDTTLGKLDDR
jgi:hypothetical protein